MGSQSWKGLKPLSSSSFLIWSLCRQGAAWAFGLGFGFSFLYPFPGKNGGLLLPNSGLGLSGLDAGQ